MDNAQYWFQADAAGGGYQIERSLRFNSADSAFLGRAVGTTGNRTQFTWSSWVKRSALGVAQNIFGGQSGGFLDGGVYLDSNDTLSFSLYGNTYNKITTAVFRDCSAWYHIVVAFDSPNATAANRIRIYVNGVEQTSYTTQNSGLPPQNYNSCITLSGADLAIGKVAGYSQNYFNGYFTEINFIDGQALTPSSFGEINPATGVWRPKKYTGTYGTNGFYLNFSDNSDTTSTTLGKDGSGNGNNWTPNNFSVAPGAGNDSMIDTPTPYDDGGNGRGNYCTWNPLNNPAGATFSNGNLQVTNGSNNYRGALSTFAIPTSGKWYWETRCTSNPSDFSIVNMGIAPAGVPLYDNRFGYTNSGSWYMGYATFWFHGGTSIGPSYTTDVFQIAFDAATNKLWLGRNNLWYWGNASTNNTTGNPGAGTNPSFTLTAAEFYAWMFAYNTGCIANFGQHPFAYTPPAGFLALNTQNLPEPIIKKPSSYMDVVTYTGTGSALTPTSNLGFSPDLVWIKSRSAATDHALYDVARGADKWLESNNTDAEVSGGSGVTAFNSAGFTLGTRAQVNTNAVTYVAWCWDESATPGFDIVTFRGTGTTQNFSHSLGVAPKMMLVKSRSAAGPWWVYHESIGATKTLFLNLGDAALTFPAWDNTAPTSSVFTVGTAEDSGLNLNSVAQVAYLWSEVAGFSKFGSYTGNGSTDGPFVYCGFRPRWVMFKRSDGISNWMIVDAARSTTNVTGDRLYPDAADAEYSGGTTADFTANGFKLRSLDTPSNGTTGTYIFAAFAESPFKYSLAR